MLLFISTLLAFSNMIVSFLVNAIVAFGVKESESEKQLRTEAFQMKRQLQTISMIDQFPAYAKLQRKIAKVTEQYKEKVLERKSKMQKSKMTLNVIFKAATYLCTLWVVWFYRDIAVASFRPELLWPIAPLLSLPFCKNGEISIPVWIFLVRTCAEQLKTMINAKVVDFPKPFWKSDRASSSG